ncbi:hypothetical protein RDI58_011105 [Solanum bulbocastanum]|uniref:Uncharacterized protein n=1 Tax=Solanum bulbocastanum TaxID=147425 RepID=A0AAN8YFZ2_SOLBU
MFYIHIVYFSYNIIVAEDTLNMVILLIPRQSPCFFFFFFQLLM